MTKKNLAVFLAMAVFLAAMTVVSGGCSGGGGGGNKVTGIPLAFDTDKDGNTLTLIDVIADKSDIADEIDTKIKVEKLRVILPVCLTERERLIIEMRYGLCGREELTQREIAKKLNISRSYVSRIEKSALEKLRKQF